MNTISAKDRAKSANLSIFILSLAAFVIFTTEFIVIGLMPNMARDLNISIPVAGQLVTSFALIIIFAGPIMTALFARVERRALFAWILVVFAISNVAVALAPGFWTIMIVRIIPATLLPVFWGVGSEAAAMLVPKKDAGKAISKLYLGLTGGLLFGIPLGTVLGDAVGWRGAFWFLAVISIVVAVLLAKGMPKLPAVEQTSLKSQIKSLSNRYFIANLVLTVAILTAMYGAYTYLADMLEGSAGIAPAHVGWWLMGFGTVGLYGNYLAGRLVDRYAVMANVLFCLLMAVGAAGAILFVGQPAMFIAALAVWGIAHTALFPLSQARVMKAANEGKALAGTLNVSACNCGIAAGASLGGWAINLSGISAAIFGASILIALCAVASPAIERLRPKG
ncbi:MFS transporter [Paenibacillus antibioticophila]|uniref:MFS transporter n=1 Tax=Paenibacillus antibioticophila TaxID=1274374 RepID=UPI0005C80532|nr:MFS transporter [Paenibacillus antibioticophila]